MDSTKQKLFEFLKENKGKVLTIDALYPFFRLLTQALYAEKRWASCAEFCRNLGIAGPEGTGQDIVESVLEHTGIDIPMLGAMMLAMEIKNGTAQDLDVARLHLAFTLHDVAEALKGDVCFAIKGKQDEAEEDTFFGLIMSVFPPEVREYFNQAYILAEERSDAIRSKIISLSSISRNGRFFWAVELVGYFIKILHEVARGYRAFADPSRNHAGDILALRTEFYSFRTLMEPVLEKIGKTIVDNPVFDIRQVNTRR